MPLTDWLLVIYLMDSSKRRISAKEVERMLGVSYETAWNMHHRIGQAMEKEDQRAFMQKLIGVIGVEQGLQLQILFLHLRAVVNQFQLVVVNLAPQL